MNRSFLKASDEKERLSELNYDVGPGAGTNAPLLPE
jgi:hypothetical protein